MNGACMNFIAFFFFPLFVHSEKLKKKYNEFDISES